MAVPENLRATHSEKVLKAMKAEWTVKRITFIILDDCAASKDVKGDTGELVNLAYSVRPVGISVWVVTQKYTAITTDFWQNSAVLVLFCTPSAKTMKAIFDDWAGKLSHDEYKGLISKLKERKCSYLVFSSRHPFGVKIF